ncbi:Por secretion system C-terminal sorting domain-containing protein [Cnuella takakiae]|uniref:Por secretion system C-terminal sorting domain-containing protein n=1 Tax=Cnuella takakiae TaxID=1302690 RepID=A0A1M5EN32_9BACT|nr:choice-of-anchor tandem repeat GloVer-containing protein [Cnuella takakiae]OLY91233.1 hypothetical protein BUE76_04445 [Cnuella takakiae]SHF80544.1 Por secretion system C-terminal sorting domain-containing protein [Cnuella takakiae]
MMPLTITRNKPPLKLRKAVVLILQLALMLLNIPVSAQDVLMGLTSNGGPEGKGTAFTIKSTGSNFGIVKSFADWGAHPNGDLLRATDGNYYGLTYDGGIYGHGTLFRITPAGAITILKNFNLPVDGGYPKGSLMQGTDGNLYGTTSSGGPNNGGVVFKITTGGLYNIVRSFLINTEGGRPQSRLVQDASGNIYGTNNTGGTYGYGTIFKISATNAYSVLRHLDKPDGASPYGGLLLAKDGNLYGMTSSGGLYSRGTVFRIATGGGFAVIHHFNSDGKDGQYPSGDLIQGKDGLLYGMTPDGGVNYNGTVFKINYTGSTYNVMRSLSAAVEGGSPGGRLLQTSDGSFYGMAYSLSGSYSGSIFKMDAGGNTSVVKRLTWATDGGRPYGSLVLGSDGLLYGMNKEGGQLGNGTIFKVNTSGTTYTVLAHLSGWSAGAEPKGQLAIGKDSAYFGVGEAGGSFNNGTVYKICGGTTTVLKSFNRNLDGGKPVGGLVRAHDNNLYGVTTEGGANSGGTIFRISPSGSFGVVRHLKGTTDGASVKMGLTLGADSALYGIATSGGTNGAGTIFRITTGGAFSVLRHFLYTTDGSPAETGLTLAKDGYFYGLTNSKFFRISKDGKTFNLLGSYSYSTEGSEPYGKLIQSTDNNFYGTFRTGGTNTRGVIFRVTPNGVFTKLRSLTEATDGAYPKAGLVRGVSDTAFFGITTQGGTKKGGTIFRITRTGTFSVLRHLDLEKDGGMALSGLIVSPVVVNTATAQSGLTTNEDVTKAITLSGTGPAGTTYTIITQPRNGTISSGTSAARTYKPKANYYGKDSFAFVSNFGCLASSPAWVKIDVLSVNDAPVLDSIRKKSVVRGTALAFTATAKDVDAGQTKTFSLVTAPAGATINATTGAFSWTPTATGSYTLTVRVTDNGSPVLYDQETLTITVTAPALNAIAPQDERNSTLQENAPAASGSVLYPNPVQQRFTIQLQAPAQQALLRIYDSKGSLVHVESIKPAGSKLVQADASQLRPGQYFVELKTETGTETLKMIKN